MKSDKSSEIDSRRWRLIERLYNSALQIKPPDRQTFLAEVCSGDEGLLRDVISLLSSAECEDSFLEESAVSLGFKALSFRYEEMVGKNIDRYKLLALLGSGGMGEVFLAHDPRLNRHVALKLLPTEILSDRESIRRFEQEARAASAISHPNVAHIYEISEAKGRRFITMEYVVGKTLRQIVKQGALEISKAIDISAQVLMALAAAHAAGVIHRDIKPENIMVREDGYVKVLDFGLAKLIEKREISLDSEAETLPSLHTKPELIMGTSHYMSPEQIRRKSVDGRTDLWSLGVVMYETLCGERPFQGHAFGDVIISIIEQQPTLLSQLRPEIPSALEILVTKALSKSPNDRYLTANQMLADLRKVGQQLEGSKSADSSAASIFRPKILPHTAQTSDTADNPGKSTDGINRPTADLPRYASVQTRFLEKISHIYSSRIWRRNLTITILLLLIGVAGYLLLPKAGWPKTHGRTFNLQFQRLNMSGNIGDIVISPDGKYVASVQIEEGKQTIHILELATLSDLRIVQPSESGYSGLSFSPDGNYLYYLADQTETGTLYRISKLGGAQRKVLNNVNTSVTFSPDGEQIAFVRHNIPEGTPDIVVSQADGLNERTLARRTREDADVFPTDMKGVGPAWSPDGSVLACPTVNHSRNPQEMNLELLNVSDGRSRRLNQRPWYYISQIAWLKDGSGLLIASSESPDVPSQLTFISYPNGDSRQITNDPNNYNRISAASDSNHFLTLNVEKNSSIWLTPAGNEKQFSPLNLDQKKGATEIACRPTGQLIYSVYDGKNLNLWSLDINEKSSRQLTFDLNDNFKPTASPDGRYIVFVSTRTGKQNIWRMNADSTEPKQLTFGSYEDMPEVTPDSKWVIYRTGGSVKKVSIDGGPTEKLFDKGGLYPVVSPDGRKLAFFINDKPDSGQWHIEILDLQSHTTIGQLTLPEATKPFNGLRWTPDGRGLTYVSVTDGAANIWLQPLSGGSPQPLTSFKEAEILSFSWTGGPSKRLVCVRSTQTYIPVLGKLS